MDENCLLHSAANGNSELWILGAHSVALYTSWANFKLNTRWTTDRIFNIRYTTTLGAQLKYDSYVQKARQAPIK